MFETSNTLAGAQHLFNMFFFLFHAFMFTMPFALAMPDDIVTKLLQFENIMAEMKSTQERQIRLLQETITKQSMHIKHLQNRVAGLEGELSFVKQTKMPHHQEIKDTASTLTNDTRSVTTCIRNCHINKGGKPESRNGSFPKELKYPGFSTKRENSHSLKQSQIERGKRGSPTVAFSARLRENLGPLTSGHIIPFDSVKLNEGHAYSGSDGVFTSPSAGLYLFLYTITSQHNQHAEVRLTVNGAEKQVTYAGRNTDYTSSTGFEIVRLHRGDHVLIKIREGFNHEYLDDYETAFAGVRLSD